MKILVTQTMTNQEMDEIAQRVGKEVKDKSPTIRLYAQALILQMKVSKGYQVLKTEKEQGYGNLPF